MSNTFNTFPLFQNPRKIDNYSSYFLHHKQTVLPLIFGLPLYRHRITPSITPSFSAIKKRIIENSIKEQLHGNSQKRNNETNSNNKETKPFASKDDEASDCNAKSLPLHLSLERHSECLKEKNEMLLVINNDSTIEESKDALKRESIKDVDVLFGRGSGVNNHPGNVKFRLVVKKYQAEYLTCARHSEKAIFPNAIVSAVEDSGGRFMKKNSNGDWCEVDKKKSLLKASQALREGACYVRSKNIVKEE